VLYHHTLRNIPEERKYDYVLRGGILKSRIDLVENMNISARRSIILTILIAIC